MKFYHSLIRIPFKILLLAFLFYGCEKELMDRQDATGMNPIEIPVLQGRSLVSDMTVVNIYDHEDGSIEVMFSESPRIFKTYHPDQILSLRKAFQKKWMVRAAYDPRDEVLHSVRLLNNTTNRVNPSLVQPDKGLTINIDLKTMDAEKLDDLMARGSVEKSESTLTNVIPDLATAQMIFNYLVQQCCVFGPSQLDQCIPFQYAWDGCHARAHKMSWVINTKFKYSTHKIFSMANDQVGEWLCVSAQKWGGCCIRWWYHVAPLVNVNTPAGVKAYVFDPSMFDQPVLLSQWLYAQENPACASGYIANVTKISLQPHSSYKPVDFFATTFMQDPWYSYTNGTLSNYSSLTTCP